jgi:hypothetical protein
MLVIAFLVPLVVLAARVVASPTVSRDSHHRISFPLSTRINGNDKLDRVQRDRKHSRKSVKDGQRRSSTPDFTDGDFGLFYVIAVGVGVGELHISCESCQLPPGIALYIPNLDDLIVDTAGANTWVGAEEPYKVTPSSVKTGDTVVSIM